MEKNNLKNLLSKHYGNDMVNSIMLGRRKPSIVVIDEAHRKLHVPILAWLDIKYYLSSPSEKSIA